MTLCDSSVVSDAEEFETDGGGSGGLVRCRSFRTFKHEFQLEDATNFIQDGLQVKEGREWRGKERKRGRGVGEGSRG